MKLSIVLMVLLACLANPCHGLSAKGRVVVLVSNNAAPYEKALDGFKRYLARDGIDARIDVYALEGEAAKAGAGIRNLNTEGASVVYAIGSLAASIACKETTNIPIVASHILNGAPLAANADARGVLLDFQPDIQFSWLSKLLPGFRRIGVVYSPDNAQKIDDAAKSAQKMGLQLLAQKVGSPADIPGALDVLSKQIDVLWGLPDDVVLTPQTAKQILLFSFRNHIPFIGPSEYWVKSGALYSLDCDYEDIGEQSGEIAGKIIRKEQLPPTRLLWPRKVTYSLNLNTALQIKIDLPESLVSGAYRVFK